MWRNEGPSSFFVHSGEKQTIGGLQTVKVFYFVRCSRFAWPYKAHEERTAIKRELLYLKTQILINLCRNRTTAFSQFLWPDGK